MKLSRKKKKQRGQKSNSNSTPGRKRKPNSGGTKGSKHKKRREKRAKKDTDSTRGQKPLDAKKPVYDLFKGRNVYLIKDANGKKKFVPKESDATAKEKAKGLFVKDSTIIRTGKNALDKNAKPKRDDKRDRDTFPVKDEKGNTQYLPKESDATQEEKNLGLYVEEKSLNLPKQASEGGLPINDLGKNRKVYPSISNEGNQVFLPRESDATDYEKKKGLFVSDDSAAAQTNGKQMSDGKPIKDLGKNRKVYPTESSSGETVFYPKKSEATPSEIKKGEFVTDESVEDQLKKKASDKKEPKYNKDKNRFEYAYEDKEGKITYLPKESEATDDEKKDGQFVNDRSTENPADQWQPTKNGKPKYEKDRYLYPVQDSEENTTYLPLETDATAQELDNGLYLPLDTLKDPAQITALAQRAQRLHPIGPAIKGDSTNEDRLLYARTNANGETSYLPKESEATADEIAKKQFIKDKEIDVSTARQDVNRKPFAEATDGTPLWDGKTLPPPTTLQQVELLSNLKPKFDPEHGRMLYPVGEPDDEGTQQYLPLADDATPEEIIDGAYAQFITEQPLEDVVLQNTGSKTYAVNKGNITAIADKDLVEAFSNVPLQLKSNKEIQEQLNRTNASQQWVA